MFVTGTTLPFHLQLLGRNINLSPLPLTASRPFLSYSPLISLFCQNRAWKPKQDWTESITFILPLQWQLKKQSDLLHWPRSEQSMILSIYDIPCLELQYIPSWEATIQLLIPILGTRNGPKWQIQMQIPSSPTAEGVWFLSSGSVVSPVQRETTASRLLTATLLSIQYTEIFPIASPPKKWERKINVVIYLHCQKTHYKHTPQITKQSKDRERELNSDRGTHVQFSAVHAPISLCSTNQHTSISIWPYFLMKSAFF